jgi:hypothetical protein
MKYIVITTINQPTPAIVGFASLSDSKLIVVGDQKTPSDWSYPGASFSSYSSQPKLGFQIHEKLPSNHYCRKMLGYLMAIKNGATVIIDTDDDNIPYENWSFPSFSGMFETISGNGFVNIYNYFTNAHIWPRGLPLHLINARQEQLDIKFTHSNIGVWQGLADEDPDVDAIYRLVNNAPCYFDKRKPIALAQSLACPFNSQNTAFRKELFPLLYLPALVTFRYTDILRSFVAQPIMWAHGFQLGFTEASVVQKRNPHNYVKDFISEIPMYTTADKVIDWVTGVIRSDNSIEQNLYIAYERLLNESVIVRQEMDVLELWLKDLENLK